VEVIADLIEAGGEARVVDIARRLGVTPVTVTRTIGRLQRQGLVTSRPYRSIFLTTSGHRMARHSKERHRIVVEFLLALGVSPATAWIDAEGIEHHVSGETLEAFRALSRRSRRR
jgi:DtxR family manganese transport transcriptional regulator